MLSHIKQTDVSVPYRDGQYWYYTRTEEGMQYGISCRKLGLGSGPLDNAPEEVLLDGNDMAEGHAFFAIGAMDISDDGRWLAYTVDYTGFRQYTLYHQGSRNRRDPARLRGARGLRGVGRGQFQPLLHR